MKFENNWKNKTLAILENDIWEEPDTSNPLILACHRLRKKQLKDFSIGDLSLMIGHNMGLFFLVPLAYEELKRDFLVKGYYWQLIYSVLVSRDDYSSKINYWRSEKENWRLICKLFKENQEQFKGKGSQTDPIYRWNQSMLDSFRWFEEING